MQRLRQTGKTCPFSFLFHETPGPLLPPRRPPVPANPGALLLSLPSLSPLSPLRSTASTSGSHCFCCFSSFHPATRISSSRFQVPIPTGYAAPPSVSTALCTGCPLALLLLGLTSVWIASSTSSLLPLSSKSPWCRIHIAPKPPLRIALAFDHYRWSWPFVCLDTLPPVVRLAHLASLVPCSICPTCPPGAPPQVRMSSHPSYVRHVCKGTYMKHFPPLHLSTSSVLCQASLLRQPPSFAFAFQGLSVFDTSLAVFCLLHSRSPSRSRSHSFPVVD